MPNKIIGSVPRRGAGCKILVSRNFHLIAFVYTGTALHATTNSSAPGYRGLQPHAASLPSRRRQYSRWHHRLAIPTATGVHLLASPRKRGGTKWIDAGDVTQLTPGTPTELSFQENRLDGWRVSTEKRTAWVVKNNDSSVVATSAPPVPTSDALTISKTGNSSAPATLPSFLAGWKCYLRTRPASPRPLREKNLK